MKFEKTIIKNLKLIMRAKSSAFSVILGPLLIILLVGLALNKPVSYNISIGYFSPDNENSLTQSFIEELKNNDYVVLAFNDNESCVQAIKQASIHTCIIFPEDFEIGNIEHNKVDFFVDYSRANLVYRIIDTVSNELELRNTELSKGLTQTLLTKIDETKGSIDQDILALINIKTNIDSIITSTDNTKSKASSLNLTMDTISLSSIKTKGTNIYNDAKSLKTKGTNAVLEGKTLADPNASTTSLDDIQTDINSIYNDTNDLYDEFDDLIGNATSKISSLENKLEETQSQNQEVLSDIDGIKTSLNTLKTSTNTLKSDLETTNTGLSNINITSAESIVSPITTEIKPILAEETNQLVFFFPMLIMLVIMFIGIMLSGTIIIMEKNSKAFFRNFTTPTKDSFFVVTTFITSFIILLLQIIVILGLSYYFLKASIFSNLWITTIILLISTSIFILIGMIIGYFSSTQEAATMLSIAFGSVFLLLSNLTLPIETMSDFIKNLVKFNPYVISSELLKKSMLFNITSNEAMTDISILCVFLVVMIFVVFLVNKISKIKILEKTPRLQKKGYIYVPEDAYLKLDEYIIKNKKDILKVLNQMDDKEFEKHIKKKNEIANWVSHILKEKKLALHLRNKSRKKMIIVIEKDLKKEAKKESKQRKKFKDF